MFTMGSAPRLRSALSTARDAPPEPKTSAFFPVMDMPQLCAMVRNPARSVLSPCQPEGVLMSVFTLPMDRAASESVAQKGRTAFL